MSRVLNGVGPIKEETRVKVLEAASQLGYVPSALARSFARSKSGNMGVILPYIPKARLFSSYYFSEILSGMGNTVREQGYDLLVLFRSGEDTPDYESFFRMQKVDALIVLGAKDEPGEREALRKLQQASHPFIIVNQHFDGETFPEVDVDHEEGSRKAVEHLLEQGHRRIAFLNGPLSYSNSMDRYRGYQKALQQEGLLPDPTLQFEGNFSRRSGYAAGEKIAVRIDEVDAIFVANDRMAIGLLQKLREAIPSEQQLPAIVGYDDSDSAEICVPPLSSVRVPFYEMGELAARMMLTVCEDSSKWTAMFQDKPRYLLQAELIVRASSKNPKGG
ncbi:LacI family transcriptional regulator [Neobacillus mesonae]|nr:LacI family transcriptional regulator [Neobacillus mesonae]